MELMSILITVFVAMAFSFPGGSCDTTVTQHTFIVSQVKMKHKCKEMMMTVVNGKVPGPTLEVREGDSVAVHIINKSPYALTIHWHGLRQQLNCWNDGVGMITQCPIQPGKNFTYRFNVVGQEGTLWWHAHVRSLRVTLHGALVIRPRSGTSAYPFSKPDEEIPIVLGDWWDLDIAKSEYGVVSADPKAATINGKLGDTHNCSGVLEDNYILNVQFGKTYLLRMVNAALQNEMYFKIAGHKLTVVAADASYLKPYTTNIVSIAPGQTLDILMTADIPAAGRYYMVALGNQPPLPDTQSLALIGRGMVQYRNLYTGETSTRTPMVPEMPDQHDPTISFYFHGNLTSLPHPLLPPLAKHVDEHMFLALGVGTICQGYTGTRFPCNKKNVLEPMLATMNNVSFVFPTETKLSLLQAHYNNQLSSIDSVQELPSSPPKMFNFTDVKLIEQQHSPSKIATTVRRFGYNTSVDIVFQSTAMMQSDSNPMHLHGHNFFILAQGHGNYDASRDVKTYNLVDPPMRNTVLVPRIGWVAIRFIADNPGVWFMHCHYEFHTYMGMSAVFIVANGPNLDTSLPPQPADLPICHNSLRAQE